MGLDWIGLDWIGLDWIGLDWIGLDWIGLDWMGLDWIGLDWIGLDWIGLDWIGLDWIELDWIGLDWIGLNWIGLDWIGLDWIGLDWTGLDWIGLDWMGLNWGRGGCFGRFNQFPHGQLALLRLGMRAHYCASTDTPIWTAALDRAVVEHTLRSLWLCCVAVPVQSDSTLGESRLCRARTLLRGTTRHREQPSATPPMSTPGKHEGDNRLSWKTLLRGTARSRWSPSPIPPPAPLKARS